MKISSSIGVTGGQQTTMAATFAEVVAGLGYEYTWAWDMATVSATDGYTAAASYAAVTPKYTTPNGHVGLRVMNNGSASGADSQIEFTEPNINLSTHSAGTGGIPDDSIPNPVNTELDHGGRYLSWVVSLDTFTVPSGATIRSPLTFRIWQGVGSVLLLPYFSADGDGNIKAINGVNVTQGTWGTQSDYNALLGNISTITYDLAQAYAAGTTVDPNKITFYPLLDQKPNGDQQTASRATNYDMTIHGLILSATPPNVTSLPVHTSSPSIP